MHDELARSLGQTDAMRASQSATKWWSNINDLALIERMRDHALRFGGDEESNYNSHIIGAARQMGLSEDEIRKCCASDRMLTIYEP